MWRAGSLLPLEGRMAEGKELTGFFLKTVLLSMASVRKCKWRKIIGCTR